MNHLNNEQQEQERLEALRQFFILNTPQEEAFDELARLAATICQSSIALITLVDSDRVWNKSRIGTDIAEVPRAESICSHAICSEDVFVVEDASVHPVYSKFPQVAQGIRFFAGMPLRARLRLNDQEERIYSIGTLCVLDREPRTLSNEQAQALRTLSRQVVTQLELRKSLRELQRKHGELEVALRHSESFYHSLVETIPQNIFRKDKQGRFTFANSRFCETVKRPLSEILGKTDFDLFPPELAAKYQQDDRRVLEQRTIFKTIEQHQDQSGNSMYVQVIKSPLFDLNGEVSGVQGIFWDETDRFKAEAALAYERDLLRAMLDNVPDSIYFKDRSSRFLSVSRSLAIRLGLNSPEEAVGKTDLDFFNAAHARAAFEDEQRILRTGEPVVAKPEKELSEGGRERWVLTTKVPLKDSEGQIIGTFGISKDITELKLTEAELAKARDAALESARLKSEFLANMSHEIRTPLNAVIGMTGLLLDTPLSEEQRDFTETIRKSADALLNIINDILDFSKIEAGKMAIEIIDFDLTELVEGTAELLAEPAQAKGIELATWIHENVPRQLRGDPGRLRQVLTNLLGNAVKFTQKGEVVVDVSLHQEREKIAYLKFAVRDTGIGIAPEAQERIFQAFVQADGSTTRRYGGTGLGLAISRQLIELMQGELGYESAPGQGSIFWFVVPFEKQAVQAFTPATASTLQGFRVLVVDDNQTNRHIVHHQVISWGMRNGSADSAKTALELLERAVADGDPYHVAILDMQMPEMDGLALAREIQKRPALSGTKLVMLTSLGYLPEERRWRECGVAAYLVKPAKETRLFDTLVNVLRGVPSPRRGQAREQLAPQDVDIKSVRVLVAEDNMVNQKVALRQLQKLGFSADAVANGKEVLAAIEQVPYDIILMDCQMPELDGYETTRIIRGQEAKNPEAQRHFIIAMTANALAGDREECFRAGMDDYISKPVRIEQLDACLRRGVKTRQAGGETELLDREVIQSLKALRVEGESDPLQEVTSMFLEDTPQRLEEIEKWFAQRDLAQLEHAVHSLKGSAGNLGVKRLTRLCAETLQLIRAGELPPPEQIPRFREEFERIKPALEQAVI